MPAIALSMTASGEVTQQVAALGNHRFASKQRPLQGADRFGTALVSILTPVQQRHDHTGIEQYPFTARSPGDVSCWIPLPPRVHLDGLN
jgi:hypothetical protein